MVITGVYIMKLYNMVRIMSNFDVDLRTILKVKHGSHAYGLNTPESDVDIKGVCIEPKKYHYGFMHCFEQKESMDSKAGGVDSVTYSLKKFARLAADCNPNIIEILFVDDSDVMFCDEFGEQLRSMRNEFLSKRVRHTFSGYAHSQLHRIKTHRAWLLDPPKCPPSRKEFGLSDVTKASKSDLGAFEAMQKPGEEVELPNNIVTLFVKEKAYQAAVNHYEQFDNWKKQRNPARAMLEAKHGYDVKHGMHLIRLMRMCKEMLVTGKVFVKRDDREDLLDVRNGKRTYDSIIDEAECLEKECEAAYKFSMLPHHSDRTQIDAMIVSITERYLSMYG